MHMSVYRSIIHYCQSLGRNQTVLQCELIYKLWYIQTTEYYAVLKMSYQDMKKQGGSLNAYG